MSEARRILRSTLSTLGVRMLLAVSVLVVTPYLFRKLGPPAFGTWNVIYTIGTVCSLIEVGFSTGATKLVAALRGEGNRPELEATVGTSVWLMGLMGVLAAIVLAVVGLFCSSLAASGEETAFTRSMILLAATMLVRLPTATYGAALLGYQRANLFNAGESVAALVFPIGAVAALETHGGIFELAIAYAVALLAGSLTFAILLKRTDPNLPLRPRFRGHLPHRQIARFSSLTLLADSMLFIGTRMDTVVIAAIRGAAAAGPYAAALKLQSALQSLTFPIYLLFMPMTAELWAAGKRDEVRRRLVLATRVAAQITLPAALALALFSGDLIRVWLGPAAPSYTAEIVVVLVATQAVTLIVSPAERMMIGIGKAGIIAAISVVEGVTNLPLSIILVSSHGAIGAAVGTMLTYGLIAPFKLPIAARATGCRLGRLLGEGLAPAVLSTLPPLIWMLLASQLLPGPASRLLVGFGGGLCVALLIGTRQTGFSRLRGMFAERPEAPSRPVPTEGDVIEI